ncbi:MAG TPA: hypothetical protein VEZ72_16530 [Paenibacillus sp.]|nr:hypothetical protein [Paenibacillus sp.]
MNRLDSEEMKERIHKVKEKILEISYDPTKNDLKEFYVMGLITPILDDLGADPAIIVGGHAVELYTSGSYKTADVDLVIIRDDLARSLFDRLGFLRQGRHHYIPELDIPIEIPSSDLAGSKDRVLKLNTPDGYCYVIGVEDLIVDRLQAAEFWTDSRSLEWARYLISSQFENLDMDYLRKRTLDESPKLLERLEVEYNWVVKNMKD